MNRYVGVVEREQKGFASVESKPSRNVKRSRNMRDSVPTASRLRIARAIQLCVISLMEDAVEGKFPETSASLFSVLDAVSRDVAKHCID